MIVVKNFSKSFIEQWGKENFVKLIDFSKLAFWKIVTLSLLASVAHWILQFRWIAIRDGIGPRPIEGQIFIYFEGLLILLILHMGSTITRNKEETSPKFPYIVGVIVAVGIWILVSFVFAIRGTTPI